MKNLINGAYILLDINCKYKIKRKNLIKGQLYL